MLIILPDDILCLPLPEVDCLPPSKIKFYVVEKVTVFMTITKVNFSWTFNAAPRRRRRHNVLPSIEYSIPSCAVSTENGVLTIYNMSDSDLIFRDSQVIARGQICYPKNVLEADEVKVLNVNSKTCRKVNLDDIYCDFS